MFARARRGRIPLPGALLLLLTASSGLLCAVRLTAAPEPVSAATNLGADWGSDHVGLPAPEYVTGDECLFCHRDRFGADWLKNAHQRTVRAPDESSPALEALRQDRKTGSLAKQVEFLLGERQQVRFLKRTGEYGKLALLSAKFSPPPHGSRSRKAHGTLSDPKEPQWDNETFGQRCAGCHSTAVDSKTGAFSATSLDCFTCHGTVDSNHTKDTALVYFGRKRKDPPRVVVAICGQCHLRNAKSKSTGRPYPNNFVAGDNLFRDFQPGLSDADLAAMNPGDRHVALNVREVLLGKSNTTCTSCHDVHRQSAIQHRQVAEGATCISCHEPGKPKSKPTRYAVHSALCGY